MREARIEVKNCVNKDESIKEGLKEYPESRAETESRREEVRTLEDWSRCVIYKRIDILKITTKK